MSFVSAKRRHLNTASVVFNIALQNYPKLVLFSPDEQDDSVVTQARTSVIWIILKNYYVLCLCHFQHLLKLNNFNSLMAVIGAITHSSIARLHKTFSYIPTDMQKVKTLPNI